MESITNWGYVPWGSAPVTGSASLSPTALYGNKSVMVEVTSASKGSNGRIFQIVQDTYLEKGATYTLSCYVKTEGLEPVTGADPYGAVICAALFNTDDTATSYYSDYISTNTNTDINKGFRRLSVTFTVPNSANFD